jgi:hypothetical protein
MLNASSFQFSDGFGGLGSGKGWVLVDTDATLNNKSGVAGDTMPMLLSEYSTTLMSAHQIQLIALAPNASYTVGADIDLSGTGHILPQDVWTHEGLVPVNFGGTFDGAGHTLSNLTESRQSVTSVEGLFRTITATGTVENLTLDNFNIYGLNILGIVAGANAGDIRNVAVDEGGVSGQSYLGGIVGSNLAGGKIGVDGPVTTYEVGVYASGDRVGGLAGWNAGTIGNAAAPGATSENRAQVVGVNQVGGIAGWNDGTITDVSSSPDFVSGSGAGIGGLVGYNTGSAVVANSTVISSVAGTAIEGLNSHEVGGAIGDNRGTASGDSVGVTGPDVIEVQPSGNSLVTGGFVGRNEATGTISNSSVGFFTDVIGTGFTGGFAGDNAGTLTNVSSSALEAVGSADRVGGIAGSNEGTITGAFSFTLAQGADFVGGLVGWNDGAISNSGAAGVATASSYAVGGAVGYASATSVLNSVYASGTVNGAASSQGGLVGVNNGSISNAYANAAVGSANAHTVGGLVGNNFGALTNVYAAGTVTGVGKPGALIATNQPSGTVTNGYYDTLVTGALSSIGVNYNTAGTQLHALTVLRSPTSQASYNGFDFSAIWMIVPGKTPTLKNTPTR